MSDLFNMPRKIEPPEMPAFHLDPNNPHLMAGQIESALQDMYHGMAQYAGALESIRGVLGGANSDDIDVEPDPVSGRSYWYIPTKGEDPAEATASSGTSGLPWFVATGTGTDTVTFFNGYGCYAGTWTEISNGSTTLAGFSTDGTWYACVKIDFSTGTWSFYKSTVDDTLPVNTDSVQYYPIAKVVVASSVIESITQLFNQWCIYENRV